MHYSWLHLPLADYTIYLPTKPGSGLDQWAQVVIKELKKHVDGEVKSVHIPGARHLIGMNKWNKDNRFKENAITVTGGTTTCEHTCENRC